MNSDSHCSCCHQLYECEICWKYKCWIV